jgi:hypothetical protein
MSRTAVSAASDVVASDDPSGDPVEDVRDDARMEDDDPVRNDDDDDDAKSVTVAGRVSGPKSQPMQPLPLRPQLGLLSFVPVRGGGAKFQNKSKPDTGLEPVTF